MKRLETVHNVQRGVCAVVSIKLYNMMSYLNSFNMILIIRHVEEVHKAKVSLSTGRNPEAVDGELW